MKYVKILMCFGLFMTNVMLFSQNMQYPSLSTNKHTTLVIDSIPVATLKSYQLSGINKDTSDWRLSFGTSHTSTYPSFGISRIRPHIVLRQNAFTHKSLFDPIVYNAIQRQTWDNPYGTDSFGAGVISGGIQLISGIFKK